MEFENILEDRSFSRIERDDDDDGRDDDADGDSMGIE